MGPRQSQQADEANKAIIADHINVANNAAEVDKVDEANDVIATKEAVKAIATDAFNEVNEAICNSKTIGTVMKLKSNATTNRDIAAGCCD